MSQKTMLTAVFRDRADAEAAFDFLRLRGYSNSEVNVLMSDRTRSAFLSTVENEEKHEAGSLAAEGMGIGGAIGTAVGATIAAVAAIGTTVAIPGLGLIIAGPLAAGLAGGGAGAVAGGLIGALFGASTPEPNAEAYTEALRNGGIVIGVEPHSSVDRDAIEARFKELNGESVCCC
jgi:hypothetical protein